MFPVKTLDCDMVWFEKCVGGISYHAVLVMSCLG